MSDEQNQPPPPPDEGEEPLLKIVWLCAAFLPSAIGIACLHIKAPGRALIPSLSILNLICCVTASVGLVRGMKNDLAKTVLGFFLFFFFFVLNTLIVLFVGCSGTGRIAP